jgi:threonine/homoserine/homoserine lactone efflux protein
VTTSWLPTLATIAFAQGLAAMSPGPAFLLVSRAAAGGSRGRGIATGLGVATACSLWATAATFGAAAVLTGMPALYGAIQFAGATYLIWLGLTAWRAAGEVHEPAAGEVPSERWHAAIRGLWLSLGNPKIVVFYSSIFVSLIPADAPTWVRGAALGIVLTQEFLWYLLVAVFFSRPLAQALYRRLRGKIERAMGAVFITLGARIAAATHF